NGPAPRLSATDARAGQRHHALDNRDCDWSGESARKGLSIGTPGRSSLEHPDVFWQTGMVPRSLDILAVQRKFALEDHRGLGPPPVRPPELHFTAAVKEVALELGGRCLQHHRMACHLTQE